MTLLAEETQDAARIRIKRPWPGYIDFRNRWITGRLRKLHAEKLHNPCSVPNIFNVIKSGIIARARRVARMRNLRNLYKIFVKEPESKRQLERPKSRLRIKSSSARSRHRSSR
jgi:hypothetical protein